MTAFAFFVRIVAIPLALVILVIFVAGVAVDVIDHRRKLNSKLPVIQPVNEGGYAFPRPQYANDLERSGLTRRQLYAAMILQGTASRGILDRQDAIRAWQAADALLATEHE